MKVTVNYNDDSLSIEATNRKLIVFTGVRYTHQTAQILEEIFNALLDESRLSSATPYFDITLETINEDNRRLRFALGTKVIL